MKIRIKGNSIRLRLTRTEVSAIENGRAVTESVSFGAGVRLDYSLVPLTHLEPGQEPTAMRAEFDRQSIRILVPRESSERWARSETEVSLQHRQPLREGDESTGSPLRPSASLELLIEKDFCCLKPRGLQQEDESDLFVNPNEAHGRCR